MVHLTTEDRVMLTQSFFFCTTVAKLVDCFIAIFLKLPTLADREEPVLVKE
jgi:hypothetical protein